MSSFWYALRSKAHKEHVLWEQVQLRGYEVFYPRLRVTPVNPRSRKVIPYFPGYLFVNVNVEAVGRSTFQRMPFSLGLVSFGGDPALVPDSLIHALRQKLESINRTEPNRVPSFEKGERIIITSGPFEGVQALFDTQISGKDRAKVLIDFLSGQRVRLDVRLAAIDRVGNGP
jgi:transcription antitermination factor NusG